MASFRCLLKKAARQVDPVLLSKTKAVTNAIGYYSINVTDLCIRKKCHALAANASEREAKNQRRRCSRSRNKCGSTLSTKNCGKIVKKACGGRQDFFDGSMDKKRDQVLVISTHLKCFLHRLSSTDSVDCTAQGPRVRAAPTKKTRRGKNNKRERRQRGKNNKLKRGKGKTKKPHKGRGKNKNPKREDSKNKTPKKGEREE